jgi:hypothetical protein
MGSAVRWSFALPIETARPDIVHRTTCRVCGASDLLEVLGLGPTPLANSFLRSPAEFATEQQFPLDLVFCPDCSLLQLPDVVNPELMFRHYLYVTGTSSTMAEHNQRYARTLGDLLTLTPADLVVDVASNDGSLLQCFRELGVATLGIEPASNLAADAAARGIDTVNDYMSLELARSLVTERQPARVVTANNVLAHVDDLLEFLAACRTLVADDGLITIEVPYVRELLRRVEYDTVYHEHLSYFSITALLRLCDRARLAAMRIDHVDIHGGSLRLYLSRSASGHAEAVEAMAASEHAAGLTTIGAYRQFAEDTERHRDTLVAMLEGLHAEGKRVVGYGAPAKGNTLLNYCRIDTRLLPYTVDKNPLKVGLLTPGMHIPVKDVSTLLEDSARPDYVLILAWNVAAEIIEQQQRYRDRGGRFIIPIPQPKVL